MRRIRGRLFLILAVACAGTAAGAALAVAGSRSPDPLTRKQVYHKGMTLQEVAAADVFNERLQQWEHFYNYARPHGALGGQTPYERLRQKTTLDVTRPRQSHNVGRQGIEP